MPALSLIQKTQIIHLRLLIARAAQPDSLNWWDDNSLSPAGDFLIDKLFLYAPQEAGRKLGLEAAASRYRAAFNHAQPALHLFRLEGSGEVEHGLREVNLLEIDLPQEPILTIDSLKQPLLRITGEPPGYSAVSERAERRLEIRLKDEKLRDNPLRMAQVFAWAMLEGRPGAPLFPYLPDHS